MLELPDVTLVCVHNNCRHLTRLAAEDCQKNVRFGDVKIIVKDFANEQEFAEYTHYQMPTLVKTSHVLFFQWDGWIINPSAWRDEFLMYDYIGAPWWYQDNYNIGNSGFCLRSKALMEYLAQHKEEYPIGVPEDHVLCREHRKRLQFKFKWAPEQLAYHFSFERTRIYPVTESFGFHGIFNWPYVLSDSALHERLNKAPDYVLLSSGCREVMQQMLAKTQLKEEANG